MSAEIQTAPQLSEIEKQAALADAANRLALAYERDGRQSAIDAVHEEIRALQGITAPKVEQLPPTRAHKTKEFTGAARRIQLTSGGLSGDGGYHRHQRP